MPQRIFTDLVISKRHKRAYNVFASAARTATPTAVEFDTEGAAGLHIVISATAASATPSVVFTVEGKSASGIYYTLLASAAVTGVSTTVLRIGPAVTASANAAANDYIPETVRISPVHGDADSITYTVDAELIN